MSTPILTGYDPDQLTVAFGPILIDGFQDGEGVTIEVPDSFTKVVGMDGKVARSKNLDQTAKITIKLLQTSASNDLLFANYLLDRKGKNLAGVMPLYVRDNSGRALYTASQAWISKAPDVTFDREATSREWVLECAQLLRADGGN